MKLPESVEAECQQYVHKIPSTAGQCFSVSALALRICHCYYIREADSLKKRQSLICSRVFMEPEDSLQRSQEPATRPYLQPVESSPQHHTNISLRSRLILSSMPKSPNSLLSSWFSYKVLCAFLIPLPYVITRPARPS